MPTENFKQQSASKSRENSCHHERHLNGVALKVYNLHWRLSRKSKDGTVAITNQRIAKLIGARVSKRSDHITRVKTSLVRNGWMEFLGVSKGATTGTWAGGRYSPVSHEDWAECKTAELGRSPCNPTPLLNQVSLVKPGGRAYQQKAAEVRTDKAAEVRTAKGDDASRRARWEVRTDLVVGSTSTVRSGKYAQSVDFSTGGLKSPRRESQLIQGELPPEAPQSDALIASAPEGGKPPSKTPPKEKPAPIYFLESQCVEAWRVLEPWGVGSDEGDERFRECWRVAYRKAVDYLDCLRSKFRNASLDGEVHLDTCRLLEVMDLVIAFCEKHTINVPASFQEAGNRVKAAEEVRWEEVRQNLAEQKRKLLEKYPELAAPSDATTPAAARKPEAT